MLTTTSTPNVDVDRTATRIDPGRTDDGHGVVEESTDQPNASLRWSSAGTKFCHGVHAPAASRTNT